MKSNPEITCPRCGAKNTWRTDNPVKPFCSERCKLIDLGGWASEQHKIIGEEGEGFSEDTKEDK
ncbi:MAG: DNA gyrase inhibitor YacG [Gammaproteobacteria bacterium]|nr:DNA gyrase inhibitor YacG [Gammaproteobacteria bacterium]